MNAQFVKTITNWKNDIPENTLSKKLENTDNKNLVTIGDLFDDIIENGCSLAQLDELDRNIMNQYILNKFFEKELTDEQMTDLQYKSIKYSIALYHLSTKNHYPPRIVENTTDEKQQKKTTTKSDLIENISFEEKKKFQPIVDMEKLFEQKMRNIMKIDRETSFYKYETSILIYIYAVFTNLKKNAKSEEEIDDIFDFINNIYNMYEYWTKTLPKNQGINNADIQFFNDSFQEIYNQLTNSKTKKNESQMLGNWNSVYKKKYESYISKNFDKDKTEKSGKQEVFNIDEPEKPSLDEESYKIKLSELKSKNNNGNDYEILWLQIANDIGINTIDEEIYETIVGYADVFRDIKTIELSKIIEVLYKYKSTQIGKQSHDTRRREIGYKEIENIPQNIKNTWDRMIDGKLNRSFVFGTKNPNKK